MTFFSENNSLFLKDGIYYSNDKAEISYPEDGNEDCFQIEEHSFWFKHRNRCILSAIKNYTKQKTFFDVGGGNGFVSKFLQDNGFETYLLEPGLKGIFNAQKRGVKNLINSALDDNIQNNSVSNIGIFDVLEHIQDDLSFLKNIHQKLTNEGLLFITVPAYRFLWSNEDIYAGHYRRYRIKKIKHLLKKAGFQIEYASYFFSILILPIFIFRTIPSVFSKRRKVNLNKNIRQHRQSNSSSLVQKIWNWEIRKISKLSKIHFGSSCLIVAKKNNDTI
jgi:SAM-dependent methyltransferase